MRPGHRKELDYYFACRGFNVGAEAYKLLIYTPLHYRLNCCVSMSKIGIFLLAA